ncbi:MAG: carboxypeptidase-like regulatory domain-containing protein [Acidobacteriota bacterium]
MPKLRFVAIAITAVSLAPAFQIVHPTKSPYERRGLFHATIRGQIVSPSGEPVGGVHIQVKAGRPRSLPIADVVTGADGRFKLSNVNSIYPPYLSWFPPEDWLDGGISLAGESAAALDIGVIQLSPATVIRVAVELVGGSALASGNREPTVILQNKSDFGPRVLAGRFGSEMVLRGVSFDEGTWEVRLFTKRGMEEYAAPFHGQLGRRDQKFTLRLLRDTVTPGEYALAGKMEVSESIVPASAVTREFTVSGKVVGPDGSPIEGAIVSDFGLPPGRSMLQWVRSGPEGDFILRSRADHAMPGISYGDSDYWNLFFSKPSLRDVPDEEWLRTPHTIVMPQPSRLSIRVSGLDASKVRAAWWHDSFGWQRFSSLRPWVPAGGLGNASIKVAADGYLPLTQKLEVPYFDSSKAEAPTELPLEFRFDPGVRRTLSVLGAGKPLGGATVDVESIVNLDSDQRRVLDTYLLPTDGRLQLLGGGDQIVEVFVYAEGFEPRRVIWNIGALLVVDLMARSSIFEFAASTTAMAARVREAQSPRAVRTISLSATRPTLAHIAPGVYDITCYNARGAIAGYQRIAVAAAGTAAVDCSLDQRPRLTVRLPGEGWRLSVSESSPRGGATQWLAMIPVPGAPGFSEVSVTPVSESKTEAILALSYAGKWHIEAQEAYSTPSLWRDIEIQPGASMTLALPKDVGMLKGSMRTYGGGIERSDHGFAGPRLQLIADDPANWSVTEYLPKRDSREGEQKHHFTLTGIPAGNYHLYQHLIGEPKTYTYGGNTTTYTAPIAAWGGVPVHMEKKSVTMLKDFSEYPLNDLHVRVADADGRPVEHATLRIRDRMSDSWRQVEENSARLEEAAHPIPYPAAARVVGGRATLPRIREGWLDLSLESDNGAMFDFTVTVSPKRELSLTLPAENR